MIVFLGNSGSLPDNTPWAIVLFYALFIVLALAFISPVLYSFMWLTLLFLGIQVDWVTGFRFFWIILLSMFAFGYMVHLHSVKTEKEKLAKWVENHN